MSGGYAEARDLILKELAGALGNVEETEEIGRAHV